MTTSIDRGLAARIVATPLPDLPPIPDKGARRRWRAACTCCGTIYWYSGGSDLCQGCRHSGCSARRPDPLCPQRMKATMYSLCGNASSLPDLATVAGNSPSSERDDDRVWEDTVICEHIGLRNESQFLPGASDNPWETVPWLPPAPPPPTSLKAILGEQVPVHYMLTEGGWYYERVAEQEPLVIPLDRPTGMAVYAARAGHQVTSHPDRWVQGLTPNRPELSWWMRVRTRLGWEVGMRALAELDRVRPFLFRPSVTLALLRQVGSIQGMIWELDAMEAPPQERVSGLMTLFGAVKARVRQREEALAGRKTVPKSEAQALLLAREILAKASDDMVELLIR